MERSKFSFRAFIVYLSCFGFLCCVYKLAAFTTNIHEPDKISHIFDQVKVNSGYMRWTNWRSLYDDGESTVNSSSYSLNTENCYIPAYTEVAVNFLQNITRLDQKLVKLKKWRGTRPFDPDLHSWVTDYGDVLNLNLSKRSTSQLKCCLRKLNGLEINGYNRVTRLNTSRNCTSLSPKQPFLIQTQNMVLVECYRKSLKVNRPIVYQNPHVNVPVPEEQYDFWQNFKETSKTTMPSSVFVIGIDGLSHASIQAYLPKSYQILASADNRFTRFKGFSSLGTQNVLQSLIRLLTGKSYAYWLRNCDPEEDIPKREKTNNCDMGILWKLFRNLNYETLFAEELSLKSALNPTNSLVYDLPYSNQDIHVTESPKIHTLYKFQLAQLYTNNSGRNPIREIFEFGTNFYRKFTSKPIPTFSFLWFKEYLQSAQEFDSELSEALNTVLDKSTNTFIILVSGRGPEAQTEAGSFEQKLDQLLPALYIRFPPDLFLVEPSLFNFLQLNSARLTTPYDLHEMLKSIITLGVNTFLNSELKDIEAELGSVQTSQLDWVKVNGLSLLTQEVGVQRTCDRVKIPLNACPCSQDITLAPSGSAIMSSIMAQFGLEQATHELMGDSEFRSLCSPWEFKRYLNMTKTFSKTDNITHEDVKLRFLANPGSNIFQIRCRFVIKSKNFSCHTSTFRRLSPAHSHENYCIDASAASFNASLCYCNEL